jgi:membrane protease YdiL (CAAX protease family)
MEKSNHSREIRKARRQVANVIILCDIAGLIMSFPLFFLGYINEMLLFRGIVGSIGGFLVAFIIYKMPEDILHYEPNRARKLTGLSFIGLGAFGGFLIGFFGIGFLAIAVLGGPISGGLLGNAFLTFAWIVAPIIGGYIGYLIFKRSKYSDPALYSSYA